MSPVQVRCFAVLLLLQHTLSATICLPDNFEINLCRLVNLKKIRCAGFTQPPSDLMKKLVAKVLKTEKQKNKKRSSRKCPKKRNVQKFLVTCTRSSLVRRNRNSSVTATVQSIPSAATKSSAIFKNDYI